MANTELFTLRESRRGRYARSDLCQFPRERVLAPCGWLLGWQGEEEYDVVVSPGSQIAF